MSRNTPPVAGPVCCIAFAAGAMIAATLASATGPDVTFCELYDLHQYGRVGDVAAFAGATTSWNRDGTEPLRWLEAPDSRHPFIAQNVYRLLNDRFEQIGMAWAKNGYFALNDTQCSIEGSVCSPTANSTLGLKCTDTYSANLNASQSGVSGLGPRYEINPWTGQWEFGTSVLLQGLPDPDTSITRRLQVRDADIVAGGQFFYESYYVHRDDVDHLDSVAWKEFTFSGAPGGTWTVGMSGFAVAPNIGFAIDGWTGATQTVLAQEVPVVETVSPDGRCILASKATDLGGGTWHYEYALLNVDMARQVGQFVIDLPPGAVVSNVGFHAPLHHLEPVNMPTFLGGVAIDNAPWMHTICDDAIVWETSTNPLRWGTLYNFRFDCNIAPGTGKATLEHFTPGTPRHVSGPTIGPAPVFSASALETPEYVDPASGAVVQVLAVDGSESPNAATLHYSSGGPYSSVPMSHVGGGVWEGTIPGGECGETITHYIEIASASDTRTLPACAPADVFEARVGVSSLLVDENFETDSGWQVNAQGTDNATAGAWMRADPNFTDAQPENDHSIVGTTCFVTGFGGGPIGVNDVDNGVTSLYSPVYDLSSADEAHISYWRWYVNSRNASIDDQFVVEISNDGGSSWSTVEIIGTTGPYRYGDWFKYEFEASAILPLTDQMQMRFLVSDTGGNSIVEALIDDFRIRTFVCESVPTDCEGDVDGSGTVDVNDITYTIFRLGNSGTPGTVDGDADGDGQVTVNDITFIVFRLGQCL